MNVRSLRGGRKDPAAGRRRKSSRRAGFLSMPSNERSSMIRQGESLENPVTGEVIVFHETALTTDGEYVRVETIVQPDGFVAAAHVHPFQTERFRVLEGALEFRVGRDVIAARSGDELVVSPGTPHRF